MRSQAPVSHRASRLSIVPGNRIGENVAEEFGHSVRFGLTGQLKSLPCRFFYDEIGSQLFEKICELPEYYPTRTEDAILRDHAVAMIEGWRQAPQLVELGSGSSVKTRRIINALLCKHGSLHYIPIDVSPTILQESAESLTRDFPTLKVTGFACNYQDALPEIAQRFPGPKLYLFLGSSLGNYETDQAVDLLSRIAETMGPSNRLLLGTDLVKDSSILETAYDDPEGVTADFNRNILRRINRELGGDFDLDQFAHRASYQADHQRVEMHLVSLRDQKVRIAALNLAISFREGESIHTESSHKYTPDGLAKLAYRSRFRVEQVWMDANSWFQVQRWQSV